MVGVVELGAEIGVAPAGLHLAEHGLHATGLGAGRSFHFAEDAATGALDELLGGFDRTHAGLLRIAQQTEGLSLSESFFEHRDSGTMEALGKG